MNEDIEKPSIESLPNEVLAKILGFLKLTDLLVSRSISHHWFDIINEFVPKLTLNINNENLRKYGGVFPELIGCYKSVKMDKITLKELLKQKLISKILQNVQHLEFEECKVSKTSLFLALKKCSHLKVLKLNKNYVYCYKKMGSSSAKKLKVEDNSEVSFKIDHLIFRGQETSFSLLEELYTHSVDIKKFTLKYTLTKKKDKIYDFIARKCTKHLKHLDFRLLDVDYDFALLPLLDVVDLKLNRFKIESDWYSSCVFDNEVFAKFIQQQPTLTDLFLNEDVNQATNSHIVKHLSNLTILRMRIGSKETPDRFKYLEKLPNLTELHLYLQGNLILDVSEFKRLETLSADGYARLEFSNTHHPMNNIKCFTAANATLPLTALDRLSEVFPNLHHLKLKNIKRKRDKSRHNMDFDPHFLNSFKSLRSLRMDRRLLYVEDDNGQCKRVTKPPSCQTFQRPYVTSDESSYWETEPDY